MDDNEKMKQEDLVQTEKSSFSEEGSFRRDITIYRVISVVLLLLLVLAIIYIVDYQNSTSNSMMNSMVVSSVPTTYQVGASAPQINSSQSLNSALNYLNSASTNGISQLNADINQNNSDASQF
jgi:hypothetical protein